MMHDMSSELTANMMKKHVHVLAWSSSSVLIFRLFRPPYRDRSTALNSASAGKLVNASQASRLRGSMPLGSASHLMRAKRRESAKAMWVPSASSSSSLQYLGGHSLLLSAPSLSGYSMGHQSKGVGDTLWSDTLGVTACAEMPLPPPHRHNAGAVPGIFRSHYGPAGCPDTQNSIHSWRAAF